MCSAAFGAEIKTFDNTGGVELGMLLHVGAWGFQGEEKHRENMRCANKCCAVPNGALW